MGTMSKQMEKKMTRQVRTVVETNSNNSNKPKEYSLTFYNVRKRNKVKTNLDVDPEISRRTLSLINEDWQNNEVTTSMEEKYYHLQSRLSEVWESSVTKGYFLQYFIKSIIRI